MVLQDSEPLPDTDPARVGGELSSMRKRISREAVASMSDQNTSSKYDYCTRRSRLVSRTRLYYSGILIFVEVVQSISPGLPSCYLRSEQAIRMVEVR
jgi:hypothetical protein